jgi:hypothetical protein
MTGSQKKRNGFSKRKCDFQITRELKADQKNLKLFCARAYPLALSHQLFSLNCPLNEEILKHFV